MGSLGLIALGTVGLIIWYAPAPAGLGDNHALQGVCGLLGVILIAVGVMLLPRARWGRIP